MKITFILKDLSDVFYNGNGTSIPGLLTLSDKDKLQYLFSRERERALSITSRIGHANSFRDRVELNQVMRGEYDCGFKLELRRGYKLATFEVCAGIACAMA